METKDICCVVCPLGCSISVTGGPSGIEKISGFGCKRGETYAINEFIAPKRILTTTLKARGYVAPVISVRSAQAIPRELLPPCMDILKNFVVEAPFEIGRVVLPDILGSGVDIILTNC